MAQAKRNKTWNEGQKRPFVPRNASLNKKSSSHLNIISILYIGKVLRNNHDFGFAIPNIAPISYILRQDLREKKEKEERKVGSI